MAEARRRAAGRAMVPSAGSSGGFFIRRVESPAVSAAAPRVRRPWTSPVVGKENTPPNGRCIVRGRATGRGRGRKSPLLDWHPRTPLRDITAIVKCIERSRSRLRAAAAAEARRQQPEAAEIQPLHLVEELQPQNPEPAEEHQPQTVTEEEQLQNLKPPVQAEEQTSAPAQTVQQCAQESGTASSAAEAELKCSLPEAECSSTHDSSLPADPEQAAKEMRLSHSIETIEMVLKGVKDNTKKQPSKRASQAKILRSMR